MIPDPKAAPTAAHQALILLFRENAIPMSDRNSFLYTLIEDALPDPPPRVRRNPTQVIAQNLSKDLGWEDKEDEWTPLIDAAHPVIVRTNASHDAYAKAMMMVGNRHSKGALVELVCWLIQLSEANPDAGKFNNTVRYSSTETDSKDN